jgi:hypothetical protein
MTEHCKQNDSHGDTCAEMWHRRLSKGEGGDRRDKACVHLLRQRNYAHRKAGHGPGTVPTWTQPDRPMKGGPSTRWPMARPGDEAPTSRTFVARIAAETHRLQIEHELVCPMMPHDDPLPEAKSA